MDVYDMFSALAEISGFLLCRCRPLYVTLCLALHSALLYMGFSYIHQIVTKTSTESWVQVW